MCIYMHELANTHVLVSAFIANNKNSFIILYFTKFNLNQRTNNSINKTKLYPEIIKRMSDLWNLL